jgi:hypothetical protein
MRAGQGKRRRGEHHSDLIDGFRRGREGGTLVIHGGRVGYAKAMGGKVRSGEVK